MSKKRSVLDSLPKRRLIELANAFNADFAPTTLNKDDLVDELARMRRTRLEDLLPELTREELKQVCEQLDLDDSGREKQVIIDRILAGGNGHCEPAASTGRSTASTFLRSTSEMPQSPVDPLGRLR